MGNSSSNIYTVDYSTSDISNDPMLPDIDSNDTLRMKHYGDVLGDLVTMNFGKNNFAKNRDEVLKRFLAFDAGSEGPTIIDDINNGKITAEEAFRIYIDSKMRTENSYNNIFFLLGIADSMRTIRAIFIPLIVLLVVAASILIVVASKHKKQNKDLGDDPKKSKKQTTYITASIILFVLAVICLFILIVFGIKRPRRVKGSNDTYTRFY